MTITSQNSPQRFRIYCRKSEKPSSLPHNLVHFAAFNNHIGFYPTPSGVDGFKDELVEYVNAKGSIQFPLSGPIPYDLISRIVTYRVAENTKKAYEKKNRK